MGTCTHEEIRSLQERLQEESKELNLLTEALSEKNKVVIRLQEDMNESLQRNETEIEEANDKFTKVSMLIQLRESDIASKETEVAILTHKNAKLREELNSLEETLKHAQDDLEEKGHLLGSAEMELKRKEFQLNSLQ